VDCCGRLRTPADSEPIDSGRYGRLRTPMDGLRPSRIRRLGIRVPPGVPPRPVRKRRRRVTTDGPYDACKPVWEPFSLRKANV
jgi:hypothetical protein